MPEGPQAQRAAALIKRFAGAEILTIQHPKSRQPWKISLPIKLIDVKVKGKNIFIHLSDGSIIYNHMLMWGSWGPTCEVTGRKRLNTCFETTQGKLGYFGGGVLKIITSLEAQKILDNLGPELAEGKDALEVFGLVTASPISIGEALLKQDLVAGIGNIYKSEGLFVARIHPLRLANQVTAKEFNRLFSFLKQQMTLDAKRTGPIMTTTPAAARRGVRNFVYKRLHQPCLFCDTKIERIYQGTQLKRSTYYCPKCQPKS